jgi:DNA-directed RNA polymerase subunit alpha
VDDAKQSLEVFLQMDATTPIDLRALLVEREDCDAGTVQQLRNGLAQGGGQYRSLREVAELLKKKLEATPGPAGKKWHVKLGVAKFFLGHLGEAVEQLKLAEGALAAFYLGRALASRQEYDEALKAFEKAEKAGYTASQVSLQKAGIYRKKGDKAQAKAILSKH